MRSRALVGLALIAACSGSDGIKSPDAGPRADAPPACPPVTGPLAAGSHTLFVSFEGATITFGDCDDATTSCSSLVADNPTAVPPFLDAAETRDGRIAN